MNLLTTWITGMVMAVLAILGLILVADAHDTGIAIFGSLLFVFAVLFEFWLLKSYADSRYESHS